MFEDHKAKKAAEAQQRALAAWQAQRDGCAHLLDVAEHFAGTTSDTVLLAAGEHVFLTVTDVSLIEERRGPGTYTGRSQGISLPIAQVGGRTIRYRVGATRGHYVQGTPAPTAIDTGTMVVTDRRVIFQGGRQTRECAFPKLIGVQTDAGAGATTFSVSNRQKPTTIHYGPALAENVLFRLDLALAHFRGTSGRWWTSSEGSWPSSTPGARPTWTSRPPHHSPSPTADTGTPAGDPAPV